MPRKSLIENGLRECDGRGAGSLPVICGTGILPVIFREETTARQAVHPPLYSDS